MQIGENSAYKKSDKVVSLLPYAKDYMKEHGLKDDKFECIPNGILESDWQNPTSIPEYHESVLKKLKAQGKFIVGYFGGHALSNALDNLLEVASNIKDGDIHFVLVGDGVEKQRLKQKAADMNLENITFLDSIQKTSIPSLCNYFDCIYMCGMSSSLYRFGLCLNKMFDAMASGKPSICAITTPKTYLEEFNCGIKTDSEDTKAAVNALLKIKNMTEEERKQMGENGIKATKEIFNYESLAKKFENILMK
jgi:glycosyltransferase involved in cell wall biosynthesis